MRNKLTFPSAGMETKYVWDRHNIQNNGIYIWDKHNVINETKYYWDKYAVNKEVKYYWEQYATVDKTTYNWNRYTMIEADATFANNNYIQQVYNTETSTKYINLNKAFSTTAVPKASYTLTGTYVWLYRADNTYVRYSINDVKNNLFTCNPLYYGFVGFSNDRSYTYPYYYFTATSKMGVDSNNKLTFYNLHNTTRNIVNKPTSLTDSPTGSYYIEINMKWPTTLNNVYTYTTAPTNKYTQLIGTKLYDMLNDGFWRNKSNAVGALIKDKDSLTTLSSESSTAYPTGMSGNYFYVKTADTIETVKGEYIGNVESLSQDTYPQSGEQDGYWYEAIEPKIYYWNKYSVGIEAYKYKQYYFTPTFLKKISNIRRYNMRKGITINGVNANTKVEGTTAKYKHSMVYDGPNYYRYLQSYFVMFNPDSGAIFTTNEKVFSSEALSTYYNKPLNENFSLLNGELFTLFNNTIGVYTTKPTSSDQKYLALFTPNTVFSLDDEGYPSFSNCITFEFDSLSDLSVDFGNTVSNTSNQYYLENYYTRVGEPLDIIDWEYGNQFLTGVPLEAFPYNYAYSGEDAITQCYKNINNNIYYDFKDAIYEYEGEIGEFYKDITSPTLYDENLNVGEYYYPPITNPSSTNYCYMYDGYIEGSGNLIAQISSFERNAYPTDGEQDGFWYIYSHSEDKPDDIIKGEYIGVVESVDANAYPANNHKDQNWYIYTGSKLFQYKGDYIETVNAETINEYPKDGVQGNYWYMYQRYENNGPYKSRWIDEVETNQNGTYPSDGIQGNYWYVYKKSYQGYKLQINDWQIKGGVNYKHNINPEKDFTIGCVSSAEIDFNYDNTADDFQQYLDADYCDYWTWQPEDNDWRLLGRFWLTDAEYNRNLVKVKAFDAILATDAYVDEFIANTTYPISITDFFNNLCQLLGVTGRINSSLANTTFTFQDNFEAINITARQLLQYIAEATGGFIKVEPDGTLYLTTYSSSGKTLDNSNYISYAKQRYTVEPISGLTVKMNSDDLGVSSGDVKNNPYIIENNPLFYTQSNEEIAGAVYRLYHNINNKVYRPATIQLLQDFGINCGDIITINGDTFYVMSKELSASGCKLECFGNQYRDKQPQSINSEIVALRGKTNELVRDLEKTQSTLTDTANGLQSQITQTASSIRSEVSDNKQELESKIEQTASNITTTVSDNKKELESKIDQTAESITQTITSQGQTITEIRQDLDGISLTYNSTEGTASITIGDITISQLVDGKYVDRVVAGIDFSGYCRFSDLSTPGQTIICGDNITTGTISADRINMTGAISWGDLSDSCQDTIASFAGSGGSGGEVPSYIKSTYIDATTIKSPTIYGAKIYAGTSSEGYIKLASTGMNFYSNSSGSVCGIGYYPGKYNLPYIMLGQGVDDAGTDKGMIKKYTNGIWIGDSDNMSSNSPGGTGIFINFTSGKIQKYINGSVSNL